MAAHARDVLLILHPPTAQDLLSEVKKLLGPNTITEDVLSSLRHLVEHHKCDLFVSTKDYFDVKRKLDMDSCLLANECIDEMAHVYGKGAEVSSITHKAMHDGTPFDEALRLRVALLKGMSRQQLQSVWSRLELNPGAARLISVLRHASIKTAVVSGGFTIFACRVAQLLGCDYAFSNTLLFDANDCLTGEVTAPIVNGQVKEQVLRLLGQAHGLQREELVAIGDGANDRWMVAHAGLGVAYHAKKLLKEATPHHINHSSLDSLAYFMHLRPTTQATSPSLKELLALPIANSPSFMSLQELLASSSTSY